MVWLSNGFPQNRPLDLTPAAKYRVSASDCIRVVDCEGSLAVTGR